MRIAAVQAEPAWLDAQGTLDKTLSLMAEASAGGASVLAFPGLWFPGQPVFLGGDQGPDRELFERRYHQQSLLANGRTLQRVRREARDLGLVVCVGFSERDGDLLYAAELVVDSDGQVALHHRRSRLIEPEAELFSPGSAARAPAVTFIGDVSLLDYHDVVHLQTGRPRSGPGDLNVAMLPLLDLTAGAQPSAAGRGDLDAAQLLLSELRSYAFDSARDVMVASQILGDRGLEVFGVDGRPSPVMRGGGGFARIFGPGGEQRSETLDEHTEGLVWAELPLGLTRRWNR